MTIPVHSSRPELVFGLVGGAGTNLKDLSTELRTTLKQFAYDVTEIRLSDLLENFAGWSPSPTGDELRRITNLQRMGNEFRATGSDGAALARAAITAIRAHRASHTSDPDIPRDAHAYILHQLKHPDEVELLRTVYGQAFHLIAGHAPRSERISALAKRAAVRALKPGQEKQYEAGAIDIINNDDKQENDFGQNTRDTYPKADFFADLGTTHGKHGVVRFIELLFGHPFHTPKPDEYAMYQASAASLRSSDDNRQVGAVIVSLTQKETNKNIARYADVIAVGMNEVPRGGGGFYWEGESPDCRDQELVRQGDDRARDIKISALAELIGKIGSKGWLGGEASDEDPNVLATKLLPSLRGTQFMNIGEFGRPVHAEMAALIDGARRGVAVHGHPMYVTTFPCHNCAKHIIAAGIQKVIYLEPYPKSRTQHLYQEEVVLEPGDGKEEKGKVVFSAFTGVGPRQYAQLFSMSKRGAKEGRSLNHWYGSQSELSPAYVPQNVFRQYLHEERSALQMLEASVYKWNPDAICPPVNLHKPIVAGTTSMKPSDGGETAVRELN
ncbi:MAG TPA: anti-phage dCTP deaminase [Gemmatimonadaceae bacterium]